MRILRSEAPPSVLAFVPKKEQPNTIVVDDTGQSIIAALQRAADMAKSECNRARLLHTNSLSRCGQLKRARASSRRTQGQLRKERAYLRLKQIIFGTALLVRKNGLAAFRVRLSRHFSKTSEH